MPSGLFVNKTLLIGVKNYAKEDIKVYWLCPILLDLFALFQIFYPGILVTCQYCDRKLIS